MKCCVSWVDINNASATAQTQATQTTETPKHNKKAASFRSQKKRRIRRRSIQVFCLICVNSKA